MTREVMDRAAVVGERGPRMIDDTALPTVSYGLDLPSREILLAGDSDPQQLLATARDAERRGYDSLWVGDAPLARPRLDPLTVLAAVATAVERPMVGTAALNGVLRHPVAAAWQLASLDRLAGGRLVVAAGAGFPSPETAAELGAFDAPLSRRVARLEQIVALWRALWAGERAGRMAVGDRSWDLADLDGLPTPTRPGGPPIWYAGDGERAPAVVARSFDGWLPYPPDTSAFAHTWSRMREAAGERPVTPAAYVTIVVDDDPERARRTLDAYCRAYYGHPVDLVGLVQLCVAGSVDDVTGVLGALEAAGARHLVLRVGALDPAGQLDAIDDVIDRCRRATAAA